MTSTEFDTKDSSARMARLSASAKPDVSNGKFDDTLLFADAAQNGGDIEELSARLVALADQINGVNAARRRAGLSTRPVGEYLRPVLKALTNRQEPRNSAREPELASHALPRAIDRGRDLSPALDADAEGRLWPQLPTPDKAKIEALEEKIEQQTVELSRRYGQIAELCNARQAQTNELVAARGEIERLGNSFAELQQLAIQRDTEVAAIMQRLAQAENEKASLQVQLSKTFGETTRLSLRLLNVESLLNDKMVDVAASWDAGERLTAEVAASRAETASAEATAQAAQVETVRAVAAAQVEMVRAVEAVKAETASAVAAAEQAAKQVFDVERTLQAAAFEKRVGWVQEIVAERDRQIKTLELTCAELAACCDGLSRKVVTLEDARKDADVANETQASHIEFLEAVLKIERENSDAKIKELITQFQRENLQFYVKEQASAEIWKNIIQLLPQLAARRDGPDNAQQDLIQDLVVADSQVA